MQYRALLTLLLILTPAVGVAAEPQELEFSQKATVGSANVPVSATVSATSDSVELSASKKEGAVPVTFTFWLVPKPKPKPAATSSQAAAVESSQGIQNGIAQYSPQAAQYSQPVFATIDRVRTSAANVLDTQMVHTREKLDTEPGDVLASESTKHAVSNPFGAFWYILQTLYFYLLTLLRFIVGSAGVFYPLVAVAFLYFLYVMFRRFRRPA